MNHLFDQQLKQALQQVELPKHSAHRKQLRKSTLQLYNASHSPKRMTWKPFVFFTLPAALAVAAMGIVLTQLPNQATPLAQLSPKEVLADSLENTIKLLENSDGTYIKAETTYGEGKQVYQSWHKGYDIRFDGVTYDAGQKTTGPIAIESILELHLANGQQTICGVGQAADGCFTYQPSDYSESEIHFAAADPLPITVTKVDLAPEQHFPNSKTLAITIQSDVRLAADAELMLKQAGSADDAYTTLATHAPLTESPSSADDFTYTTEIEQDWDYRTDDPTFISPNPDENYLQVVSDGQYSQVYVLNLNTLATEVLSDAQQDHIANLYTERKQNEQLDALSNDAEGTFEPFTEMKTAYQQALKSGEVLSSSTQIVDGKEQLTVHYRYDNDYSTLSSPNEYKAQLKAEDPYSEATFIIDTASKRIMSYTDIALPWDVIQTNRTTTILEVHTLTESEVATNMSEAGWKADILEFYKTELPEIPTPNLESRTY